MGCFLFIEVCRRFPLGPKSLGLFGPRLRRPFLWLKKCANCFDRAIVGAYRLVPNLIHRPLVLGKNYRRPSAVGGNVQRRAATRRDDFAAGTATAVRVGYRPWGGASSEFL